MYVPFDTLDWSSPGWFPPAHGNRAEIRIMHLKTKPLMNLQKGQLHLQEGL